MGSGCNADQRNVEKGSTAAKDCYCCVGSGFSWDIAKKKCALDCSSIGDGTGILSQVVPQLAPMVHCQASEAHEQPQRTQDS